MMIQKKYFIKDTARELKFGEEIDAFKSIEQNGKTRLYHFDCKFVDDPELIAKLLEAELIEEVESDEEPEEDDEPVYDFNTEELVAMLMDENNEQNKDIAELINVYV